MEQNFGIEVNYGNSMGYLGSPRYGIYNPYPIDYFLELVRLSSAMWSPDMANGVRRTPLEPRTLPSGVSNGMYQQNVSVDFLLTSNLANSYITTQTLVDLVRFPKTAFVNSSIWSASTVIDGAVFVNGSEEIAIGSVDSLASIGKHYKDASNIHFIVAKGAYANLADAQTRFPSQLTRYQLATPIDTLNVPFINPVIDLSGVVGKNLFDKLGKLNEFVGTASGNTFYSPAGDLVITTGRIGVDFGKGQIIQVEKNTQYTLTITAVVEGCRVVPKGVQTTAELGAGVLANAGITASATFNTLENDSIVLLFQKSTTNTTNGSGITNIQLELGSTATAYEPYGKANVLLTNFAGTSADGYTPVVLKGIGQEGEYSNLLGDQSVDNDLQNVIVGGAVAIGTNGGVGGSYKPVSIIPSKRYVLTSQFKDPTVVSNLTLLRAQDQNTVIGAPVFIGQKAITIISGATASGLIYRNNVAGSNYYHDWSQLINLTDNPLVQSLEAKLGRQLTAVECDYLFSFTSTTATVKAGTRVGLQFDGANSYGQANHPALDIVGTGTFYFGNIIRTSALVTQYFNIKAEQSEATTQYGLKLTNTGVLSIILEGTNIELATGLLANTNYNVWVQRESGVLRCFINGIEVFSVANTTSLTSRPNFRWGALPTNVGGTTHTGFANVNLGASGIGTTNAVKARQAWDNFASKTFGFELLPNIYGVSWNKGASPTLTRTDDSVGGV